MAQDELTTERGQIEQAIAHLESQRDTLGDGVVEAALAPLRDRLKQLEKRTSPRRTAGERRIVTILFSDVTGSTALAAGLDPEEWAVIMNQIFQRLIEPVERYGGTVARLMGDGLLAFFGAPVAHEDDPERAVLAGLEILEGVRAQKEELLRERGLAFDVRVGINTGLVVVGDVGNKTAVEYTALGDAVNLAARMEQTARPGTVQITEATHRLIGHLFETEPLGEIQVKGLDNPVATYRISGRQPTKARTNHHPAGRIQKLAGVASPVVGRDQELRMLSQIVARVRQGQGHIVSIIGEAGLGKSRLIAELQAQWLATQPADDGLENWREMTSTSYSGNRPYGTFQIQIQQSAGITPADSADRARAKLRNMLAEDPGHERLQSIYEVLLGLQRDEPAQLEGEAFRRELFATMLESTRDELGSEPSVLIYEDMHWTDDASVALKVHLLQLARTLPVLIVFTFRPDRSSPVWKYRRQISLEYQDLYSEIELQPLSKDESSALVNHLFTDDSLPETVRQIVLDRSDGNPLFMEEIIWALIDQGMLVHRTDGLHWKPGVQIGEINIPANLQALLAARIDRLATDIRRTLQLAAVIGRSFYYRVLEMISDGSTHLVSHLDVLQEVDLIREAGRLPEWQFMFRHALTQEAAYRTLLREERRAFHQRVGQALETLFPDRIEELAPLLALHYSEAQQPKKALHYHTVAGDSAFRLDANIEAVTHYTHALAFARQLEASGQTWIHLYERRGRALDLLTNYEAAIENYREMISLAQQQSDEHMELAGLNALATVYATVNPQFDPEQAKALSRQALTLSTRLEDRAAEARAHWNLMLAYWYGLEDAQQAVEHGEASLAIARRESLQEQLAYTLSDLGLAYGGIGRWQQGIEAFEEAREIWREINNQPMLANNLTNSAIPYFVTGDFENALVVGEESLTISRAIDNAWGRANSILLTNYVLWERGQVGRIIARIEEIRTELGPNPAVRYSLAFGNVQLAWINASMGASHLGQEQYQMAVDLAETMPGIMKPWHLATLVLREIEAGKLTVAADYYSKIRQKLTLTGAFSPGHITAFFARGRLSFAQGAYRQAIQDLEVLLDRFLEVGVSWFVADAYYYRGQALLALKRPDEAFASFLQAHQTAEARTARRVHWQILASLATMEPDTSKAQSYRKKAQDMVKYIIEHAGSDPLRSAFQSLPQVKELLD